MTDPETQKSRGFGFVEYDNEAGVLCALRVLQGVTVRSGVGGALKP